MKATRLETLEAEYKKIQLNKDESVKIMEEKEEVQYNIYIIQILSNHCNSYINFIHLEL